MNNQRLNRLHQLMDKAEFDAVAINPGPSFTYITGMRFHLMERPTVLLISQKADPILVLPKLEALKIQQCPLPIVDFTYDDNPDNWQVAFNDAAKKAGLDGKQIGVEANRLRFLELQFLQTAAPDARFLAAGSAMDDLRIHKDRQEVEYMRHAVDIAQKALTATLPYIGVGVSERTIASELMLQLLRAGSDSDFPFSPIVSGGPNGANPHASPTNRELQSGDLLVIDWVLLMAAMYLTLHALLPSGMWTKKCARSTPWSWRRIQQDAMQPDLEIPPAMWIRQRAT
jgi:Xaa-Pro dipeptidase